MHNESQLAHMKMIYIQLSTHDGMKRWLNIGIEQGW